MPPYKDITVGDLLTSLARELPEREALVYAAGPRYTFAQLEAEARTVARGLMAAGVAPGERVVVWATNVPEWIVLQFALAKIGAILVTANTSLRAKDIDYLLRQSEAATLVTIRGFRDADYVAALAEIGATTGAIPTLKRVIYVGDGAPAGFIPYAEMRAGASKVSDAEACLRTVQDERCTSLYGVPTMFIAELGDPSFANHDLSSLRTGIMAGSPCPIETMRRVVDEMHMEEVTICYGMTETSPVSTQTGAEDPLDKRVGTVGRIHPHVEIKVVDPDSGAVVDREQPGELCTRGYSVMLGYWNEPEKTDEAIDRARWMHTGDLAVMDGEGYLRIVGRIKDMVIRGGENLYPREVEEFLYGHPDVADVQVVGVPDARYGEELMAWIVPRGGAEIDRDAIAEYCDGKIARHKVPRYVATVDEFPMTVTGKVQKFKLREMAIEQLGLEEAAAIETA